MKHPADPLPLWRLGGKAIRLAGRPATENRIGAAVGASACVRHVLVPVVAAGGVYRLPLERLCMTQSISQLVRLVEPPFDQAVTWSASISCCA